MGGASEKKTVDGEIQVEGLSYELISVKGREGLSQLSRYEAIVEHPLPVPTVEELTGKDAALTLRSAGHERTKVGYVFAVRVLAYDNDKARLNFDLRPRAHAQTLGRDNYAFQDASVVDLIKDRVADVGMPVRYALARGYEKAPYRAQYREDDWSFICRSMEEEGIYYWFDHEGGQTTLVFSDDSPSSDDLVGGAAIPFLFLPLDQCINCFRKFSVEVGYFVAGIVCRQFYVNGAVYIRPVWVVVHFLSDQCHAGHKGESLLEVFKLKCSL